MSFLKEYTLLGELGTGGFAKVYKVRHNTLGYIRAIRVLNEPVTDENSRTYQKFLRECKVLLRLGNGSHRNIVHIYQPRLLENHALVEMDYVDGKDISHYLNENGNFLPIDEVLHMVEEISSALAYCHEDIYKFCMDPDDDQLESDPVDGSKWIVDNVTRKRLIEKYKVIHNDIHSGNIMRREDGSFVLLDFGLAITGEDDVRNSSRHENGAVEFKAPEKWDDDCILTEQSDIYSFGVVMYEYLAGRVPFPYDKTNSNKIKAAFMLGEAHKNQTPPSIYDLRKTYYEAKNEGVIYEKDYPDWIETIILKCLEKDPGQRFKNGKELYDALLQHVKESEKSNSKAEVKRLIDENVALGEKIDELQKELRIAQTSHSSNQKKDDEGVLIEEFIKLRDEINQKYDSLVTLIIENKRQTDTSNSDKDTIQHTSDFNTNVNPDDSTVLNVMANGVSFNMIKVAGGDFHMGAQSNMFSGNFDSNAVEDEAPVHRVVLSDYYIGETLVTQSLWQAVMGKNPSFFQNDDSPVERVNWYDVQQFLKILVKITGMNFRLPTEAEWEFAARGGKKSNGHKYSGSDSMDLAGWYSGNSNGITHSVKQQACNELGLYDMSGNVWEWCNDWYGTYEAYSNYYQTNPTGPQDGKDKVLRGGSWGNDADYCRVSTREHFSPDNRYKNYGFRLALSLNDELKEIQ